MRTIALTRLKVRYSSASPTVSTMATNTAIIDVRKLTRIRVVFIGTVTPALAKLEHYRCYAIARSLKHYARTPMIAKQ